MVIMALFFTTPIYAQDDDVLRQGTTLDREAIRTKIMNAYDAFNKDQYDKFSEFIDASYVEHTPSPGQEAGISGLITFFKNLRTAYPDYKFTVDEVIIDGNKVVVLNTFTGTNTGPWMDMKPTGKSVNVDGIDVIYLTNGKATEHWGYVNTDKWMQQLGMGMDKDKMEKK